jgi:hypothetical protein
MDEVAFRERLSDLHVLSCPFAKALLAVNINCLLVEKYAIAEREILVCHCETAHARCMAYHDVLRKNFMFALGMSSSDTALTHAKELRMQCGGLTGLQYVMSETDLVDNIDKLLTESIIKFGELANFPFSDIVRYTSSHYKSRLKTR